ncbi:MAG TPA: hypothetical protein VKX25_22085 [Bryobacteraceae bacterium]|jgi:hypothetical protein|nr:hypothetical protein [Bryobacteraceae bacterium]
MSTAASGKAIAKSYLICDRMNQLVIEGVDPVAWRAKPSGPGIRTIATIFSHVHNIRRK